jgi:hypothetical protein
MAEAWRGRQSSAILEYMRAALLGCLLSISAVACRPETLQPLPLQIAVEASRATPAPGDTINFLVTAQGGSLIGVEIDFGDASVDQFGTSGARTARVTFRHAYLMAGNYEVQATITDALAGRKTANMMVRVQ